MMNDITRKINHKQLIQVTTILGIIVTIVILFYLQQHLIFLQLAVLFRPILWNLVS